jgi:L-ascorbate metabolism protein UlaG (beta-lactamase superfamily)
MTINIRILFMIIVVLSYFAGSGISSAQNIDDDSLELSKGDAQIWYLYHCGYAVKTANHLLVFDYWEPEKNKIEGSLAQGFVDPEEIKDLSVRVFVSHSHMDHWDKRVLKWQEVIPDIQYFFGWEAIDDQKSINLPFPMASYKDDELEIFTVNSHHSGVPEAAFLVRVDGLVIFHGGDYLGKMAKGAATNAPEDMIYLRKQAGLGDSQVDLMFLNAWVGGSNSINIEKLNPKAMFPMHVGGKEIVKNREFAQECIDAGITNPVYCPLSRGDSFLYQNGKIDE